jgi:hypothetical protein
MFLPKLLGLTWLAGLAMLLPARASAEDLEGAGSLISDVARIVAAEEAEDWFSDREALRSIDEHVLASVCRATPEARAWALAGLQKRHAELGEAKALFQKTAQFSSAVKEALTAERELAALEQTLLRLDECPFWIAARPGFEGLQSDRHRFTLSVESGGDVQLRYTERHWTFGGGGLGRVLGGYGIDGRFSFLAGLEFGGSAMLKPQTNASEFVVNYLPAIPLVFRSRQLTWHYDLELAPVALFQADNTRLSYGVRIGGGFAFTALRNRNVLPWAGLAVAYERYFEGGGRSATNFIRWGLRIGLPWDP